MLEPHLMKSIPSPWLPHGLWTLRTFSSIQGWVAAALFAATPAIASAAAPARPSRGDVALAKYFQVETKQLSDACLEDVHALRDWTQRRQLLREELFEMLSLSPLPARTDLNPKITGTNEFEQFTVENLQFQSMPGLYVTGNLYVPKHLERPAPAILYVCGHALVKTNGISYGNKTAYQHHGEWFARNGYACLTIDTIELGEIQGIHHGTYSEGMWWWNSRGYTPAGVEAWNGIRALDYLQSRPEVDPERLGVTGRSGGGAYSWWVSALDDRIKAAAPVAGITDLQNHVIDGTVEGHCDCMFMVNTYRWDYPMVAALVAPRPLLICNSDKDSIFPLDGMVRLHEKVAMIYKLYDATNHLGLLITEGPHKDTQDLQLPVFRWFNRFLKGEDPTIEMAARPFFTPQQLKVFSSLPADERTSTIHESFLEAASIPKPPENTSSWTRQRDVWKAALEQKVFRGWPGAAQPVAPRLKTQERRESKELDLYEVTSQPEVALRLYIVRTVTNRAVSTLHLRILDASEWPAWIKSMRRDFPETLQEEFEALNDGDPSGAPTVLYPSETAVDAYFAPRGLGADAWNPDPRKQVQIRRRFMLLGQTVDSMRVWDIRRAVQALGSLPDFRSMSLTVEARGEMGVNAIFADLFEPGIHRLALAKLPASLRNGPDYLNVLRFMDVPQAVAMALEKTRVELNEGGSSENWSYPRAVAANLGWPAGQLKEE